MYTDRIESIKRELEESKKEITELRAMVDFEQRNADDWLCEDLKIGDVVDRQVKRIETLEQMIRFAEEQLQKVEGLIAHSNHIDARLECVMPYRPNSPEAKKLQRDFEKTDEAIELTFEFINSALNY